MALDLAFATGSGVTVTATEMSLMTTGGSTTGVPQSNTTTGLFMLVLDGVANMAKGDEYLVKVYEKARAGGIQRVIFQARIKNAQAEAFIMPWVPLGIGSDITLQRISATSRAFDWSIRRLS